MEIRVLRYFLKAAQEENITRAAEALHITQPTLSRQLSQLEEEMGVVLFERGARHITLSAEGLLLKRQAEEILELVDKTEREVSGHDDIVEGTVSVGCGDLANVEMLAELFRGFHARYPAVTFDLYTASADLVRERMDRGLIDVGLLLAPSDMERYQYVRLPAQEKFVVIMHPDAPLAAREKIRAEDLRGCPLILPRRMNVRGELARWFREEYDHLNVLFTSNLPSSSARMAHDQIAYSINILGSLAFWDEQKITWRPLDPPLTAGCVLAWKRGQPFSTAAARFIEYAENMLFKHDGE